MFTWWFSDKESACSAGDMSLILGLGRSPGKGNDNLLQYSCWRIPWTEKPGGLQSMGSKESDMTYQLNLIINTGCAIRKTRVKISTHFLPDSVTLGHFLSY